MTLQEQLNEFVLERADKPYYNNPVVLYQKIFEKVKDDVNQQRRRNNTTELSNNLSLAYFILKAKANAWAARGKDELLSQIDNIMKNKRDL